MRRADVLGINVQASNGAPIVLLRERDEPHRILPIFIGAPEALAIDLALTGTSSPRPLTHDLLAVVLDVLDAHVEHVEVTEVRAGTFHAQLALHGPTGELRLDSRPSDAIALALRVHAPVFVSRDVLEQASAVIAVVSDPDATEPDEDAIEAEVAEFRSQLDELGPDDLGPDDAGPDDPGPGDD